MKCNGKASVRKAYKKAKVVTRLSWLYRCKINYFSSKLLYFFSML